MNKVGQLSFYPLYTHHLHLIQKLTTLNFRDNSIYGKDVQYFADALQINTVSQFLYSFIAFSGS